MPLLGTLGIALLLIGLLTVFLLPSAAKALMIRNLSKTTGLGVTMESVKLSLIRPQFLIQGLRFSNPDGFPSAELTEIGTLKVRYFPPPLFGLWIDVRRVELHFKEFRLVRNEAGNLNLPAVVPRQRVRGTINEVALNLGTVTYTDLSQGQPIQKTFNLQLESATYRNVKGIAGIVEIVNWEVLKRTGVEEQEPAPLAEIKPIVEFPAEEGAPAILAPEALLESFPPEAPPPAPAPAAEEPKG